MAGTVGLHDLVGSVAGAIVDAQGVVERHYLDLIGRYFDADGRPISFGIMIPKASSTQARIAQANAAASPDGSSAAGPPDPVAPAEYVSVPLLSLVESSMLAIKQMKVELEVELGDIADAPVAAAALGGPIGAPRDVPRMAVPATGPVAAAAPGGPGQAIPPVPAAALMSQPAKSLTVGIGSRSDSGGPMARISIKVEACPPSEGLMRLLTQLNKVV